MFNLFIAFIFIIPGIVLCFFANNYELVFTSLFQVGMGVALFYFNKYKDLSIVQIWLNKLF